MPDAPLTASKPVAARDADQLLTESLRVIRARTDRLFAGLMAFQYVAGIAIALWISPRTWIGGQYALHVHVIAAAVLGGLVSSVPIYLALNRPGEVLTRHAIGVGQMLSSALLIHLTGGRIETHFHVFGSLAFLAFYRDYKVLLSATVVVAIDHCLRGLFWPQSVFGVLTASPWRWVEHAGWVVFEDLFLVSSCRQGVVELRAIAQRRAFVSQRIAQATALAQRIAAGDLSGNLDAFALSSEQEHVLGDNGDDMQTMFAALQAMVGGQRELVRELSSTSTELEASSRQLLVTLRQQEAGANEQSSAVEEARRTMDSLLEAAKQITTATGVVHRNAQSARESSQTIATHAAELDERTAEIGSTMHAIMKVADKSNFLALNAALEGTKAGDAGKGFTLVADEMRVLAENVMASANQVRALLEGIRSASRESVNATERGLSLAEETTRSAETIRMTSQQQQSGTEQATHSMLEIADLLAQSVNSSKQSTTAVADLSERASRLQNLLRRYQLHGAHA